MPPAAPIPLQERDRLEAREKERLGLHGRSWRLLLVVAVYVIIAHAFPAPAKVSPDGWRITAVFAATIVGLMVQPMPGAAMVILGLTVIAAVGGLPMSQALSGFAAPSVWLVLAAMLIARVLRDTGLSRRIALLFVRRFGRSSLGVSYALVLTDVTLAAGIPSITARSASIVLPIARSISELYESTPGPSARRLGTFLMITLYQSSVVACAMFLTGQASNLIAASLAAQIAKVEVTWANWFAVGIVPGLVSCAVVPWLVYRLSPPDLKVTPAAADYARRELSDMGPLGRQEGIVLAVFVGVCLMWMTSGWHRLDVTLIAFAGIAVLLCANILTWEVALSERSAWDVFVWYGGLLTMGELLNKTGTTSAFAGWIEGFFPATSWFAALIVALVIYFYAHYAFASITAHVLAMFPPFVVMLIGLGTPPALAVFSLACLANLTAGLTHYGTTTAPIVYSQGYIAVRTWWRVGFIVSLANLAIWLTVGFMWWKWLGLW